MNKKKIFWGVTFIVAVIVCVICGYKIISYFLSDGGNSAEYINPETETNTATLVNTVENHNINWVKLQEKNSDVYSWIYIPNTNVDYPVVQPGKNLSDDFYLNHNVNRENEFAGAIYTEKQNAKDYSDPVTVLYGHNMLNGSMFKSLHKFEDAKFFKKNKYIYIYMPNHRLTYKIYAAYVYDDRHILNAFKLSDKKVLKKYFEYTTNPNSLSKNIRKVSLDINSKIITLSTCTNGAENTRYLVQGVLIKDEQTN